jgi:hypothetical protein
MKSKRSKKSKRSSKRINTSVNNKPQKNDVYSTYKEFMKHNKPPDTIRMHSIKDKLPPNKSTPILYFDPVFGYYVDSAAIVRQHIDHDIAYLKFSRTTHWARLKSLKYKGE